MVRRAGALRIVRAGQSGGAELRLTGEMSNPGHPMMTRPCPDYVSAMSRRRRSSPPVRRWSRGVAEQGPVAQPVRRHAAGSGSGPSAVSADTGRLPAARISGTGLPATGSSPARVVSNPAAAVQSARLPHHGRRVGLCARAGPGRGVVVEAVLVGWRFRRHPGPRRRFPPCRVPPGASMRVRSVG